MLKINTILLSLFLLISLTACNNDDPDINEPSLPEYSITIQSPTNTELPAGESVHLHIDFDEANDLTVHHINVEIATAAGDIIYNGPSEAHVHTEGHYEHHDDVVLDVEAGTELILTAKVWGHTDGIAEQSTSMNIMAQ